jgi:[NiFe] hydrogenase diaphorase moiety large subunit
MSKQITEITARYGNDKQRLMDILIDVQQEMGYISNEVVSAIAAQLGVSEADVEQTTSFYHFFARSPRGKYTIYLNNSVTAVMFGYKEIAAAFEKETGCKMGGNSADGLFGLFPTACIGMCDQEPAAMINGRIFTSLTPAKVSELVLGMKAGKQVEELAQQTGDGNNAHPLMKSMVKNNIMRPGPVIFSDYQCGTALCKGLMKCQPLRSGQKCVRAMHADAEAPDFRLA